MAENGGGAANGGAVNVAAVTKPPALEVFGRLLDASHELAPDDLPLLLEGELRRAGFREAVVYVVDLEQRNLIPLRPHDGLDPLAIDATLAGRCYQSESVVESDGGQRLWVPLRDGAERLGVLSLTADPFDDELKTLGLHLASLAAELIVAKLQYGDYLNLARRSRPMTLPAEMRWRGLPPLNFSCPQVSLAAALEPAYEVAGDAFDYALNGDQLHLAIFDGIGHNLEAARVTNLAMGAYRHGRRLGYELVPMYAAIDATIASEFGPDRFVTGQLAVLDVNRGTMSWVNAGHPGPLLLRHSRATAPLERAVSVPFGLADGVPATVNVASLEPDDRLIFYTDGIVEARSADGEPFGEERLVETINSACSDQHSASEAVRRLLHAVVDHRGAILRDEATVLMAWYRRQG